MPKGLPSSRALNNRTVSAFSLDTSIIEGASFRFEDGPLRHLAGQLPPWLNIWMPDIVAREITRHRLDSVAKAAHQVLGGTNDLRRHIGRGYKEDVAWVEQAKAAAVTVFDEQLRRFLESHSGILLEPIRERLATEMFDLYFQGRPPFGNGKDKKHEFPDAASLLMLDMKARESDVYVVAVSKDEGWKAYAEHSDRLFCVSSLEELTALFLSDSPKAKAIRKRFGEFFSKPDAALKSMVRSTIEKGLLSLRWNITGPRYFRDHIDAGILGADLKSFSLSSDAVGVWITSPNNDSCVAEIPVDVEVSAQIEVIFYRNDFDGRKLDLETMHVIVERHFELKLLMEMRGPLESGLPELMIEKMDLGNGVIDVVLTGEDLGPRFAGGYSGFDHMDDSIPF